MAAEWSDVGGGALLLSQKLGGLLKTGLPGAVGWGPNQMERMLYPFLDSHQSWVVVVVIVFLGLHARHMEVPKLGV